MADRANMADARTRQLAYFKDNIQNQDDQVRAHCRSRLH